MFDLVSEACLYNFLSPLCASVSLAVKWESTHHGTVLSLRDIMKNIF